jgi:hypothetical protein
MENVGATGRGSSLVRHRGRVIVGLREGICRVRWRDIRLARHTGTNWIQCVSYDLSGLSGLLNEGRPSETAHNRKFEIRACFIRVATPAPKCVGAPTVSRLLRQPGSGRRLAASFRALWARRNLQTP